MRVRSTGPNARATKMMVKTLSKVAFRCRLRGVTMGVKADRPAGGSRCEIPGCGAPLRRRHGIMAHSGARGERAMLKELTERSGSPSRPPPRRLTGTPTPASSVGPAAASAIGSSVARPIAGGASCSNFGTPADPHSLGRPTLVAGGRRRRAPSTRPAWTSPCSAPSRPPWGSPARVAEAAARWSRNLPRR